MRDFDKSFKIMTTVYGVVFVIVMVLVLAPIGFMGWVAVKSVDAIESGSGLKDLVETVWCGNDNGTGVDCVKTEVTE